MLFNSTVFFAFFGIFSVGYFALRGRGQLKWLLLGSYVFYAWWDWRFLWLIVGYTVIPFFAAIMIEDSQAVRVRKLVLAMALGLFLLCLAVFKYANFFLEALGGFFATVGLPQYSGTLSLILPIGISFYTFEAISYIVDTFKGTARAERSLEKFSCFMAFFPRLVAGPIVRPSAFIPHISDMHEFSADRFKRALVLCAWGFMIKVVIADSLALLIDARFMAPEQHVGLSMFLGVFFYAFQIYGDFAGYSLVAIGLSEFLGYRLPMNFNRPYLAINFSDFWQRWHISLSSWLRDYLYIPLGGSRGSQGNTQCCLTLSH